MRALPLLLTLLLASASARADVIVVAHTGGDFTTLSQAVAAAADGDVILIREGLYIEPTPVIIENKSLTITADWVSSVLPFKVELRPGLVVRNLAPLKPVVLQNLLMRGQNSTASSEATSGLVLENNVSHVRVQNCTVFGGTGAHNTFPDGAPAVTGFNVGASALVGCSLHGGGGQFSPDLGVVTGHGGPGLVKDVGQLLLYDTLSQGGLGGGNIPGGWAEGGNGGAGIVTGAGTLFLAGSAASGGQGGTSHFGGNGGHGLDVGDNGVATWLLGGSNGSGGGGGWSDVGPSGSAGVGVYDPTLLVTQYGGTAHRFDLTSPARENQVGQLRLGGGATDMALIFLSPALHQLPFTGYQGFLMLMPTSLLGPFFLGPPGNVNLPFSVPDMGPGFSSLQVFVQPAYSGTDGVVLGPGRVLTVLSDSF